MMWSRSSRQMSSLLSAGQGGGAKSASPSRHSGRVLVRAVVFLLLFTVVLAAAMRLYLLPALEALKTADEVQRRQLQATAVLMLCVVLFVLFAGLLLTFRPGRFFFPGRSVARAKPTVYVDAWAEAGRRAKVDLEEDEPRTE